MKASIKEVCRSQIMVLSRFRCALLSCSIVLASGFHAQCQQRPPGDNQELIALFRAGQQNMQAGRFEQASEEFRQVLQLQPDLVEARVDLGLAYHALGDYARAVAELGQAARQRADLLPANLFLGISYLKLGSPEKAVPPLHRALAIEPSSREARRALASAELSEGEYGNAATQFRKLAASEADRAEAWFTLGQDYLTMAKQLIAQLSAQFHSSAWSYRLAGDILSERHLWNDAAFTYRKALLVEPAQPGLHSARGQALLRAGKAKEAESEFNAELSRNALEARALIGLAEVRLLEGRAQPATECMKKIWESQPEVLIQIAADFPTVDLRPDLAARMAAALQNGQPGPVQEFLLSALFRISGDADRAHQERLRFENSSKALGSHAKADLLSPSACEHGQARLCSEFLSTQKHLPPRSLLRLGQALFLQGEDEAASDRLAAALAQSRNSPEAVYWLSRTYLRLAENCFNQLIASHPDSWRAHELKGEAFHIRQADAEAVGEYRLAEQLNSDDPKIHEALGEILLGQRSPREAQAELQKALQLDPTAARSLYLMGRLCVDGREPAAAIPYLEAALRYDPTLMEAHSVLGKAYLKAGKPELAAAHLERSTRMDRYGDLHYLLYQAYRDQGKAALASQALARSQELRRKSAAEDQAKIRPADEE
jgi:tetratricopeptide (TPR) repeat protein